MRLSLRIKFTFYAGLVAIICMVLLAVICIEQSISYTEQLMHNRLAQFASLKSQQIEREANNQALTIHDAFQSAKLINSMQNLYEGRTNVEDWATSMEMFYIDSFSTTLRSTQITSFYDTFGNLLITMSNPDVPLEIINRLEPGISTLMPVDNGASANNESLLLKNETYTWNNFVNATTTAEYWSQKVLPNQTNRQSWEPVEFKKTPDKILSWVSSPVPLINKSGIITGYSISFTQPVTYYTVENDVQTTRALGFTTCVIDCSQYGNNSNILDFDGSLIAESKTAASVSIVEISQSRKWRNIFPSGMNSTADRKWHILSEFPALLNDIHDWSRAARHPEKHIHGGAISGTRVPGMKKSSVGYSYAKVINREWFLLVSMPQYAVRSGYRRLTKALVGIAIADLFVVCLSAFFLTRLTIAPSFHIYRGMQLDNPVYPNIDPGRGQPTGSPGKSFLDELVEKSAKKQAEKECNRFANLWLKPFRLFWYTKSHKAASSSSTNTLSNSHSFRLKNTLIDHFSSYCRRGRSKIFMSETMQTVPGIIEDKEKTAIETETVVECSTSTIQSSDSDCMFKVSIPIKPLNRRWIVDEFDDLIAAYNLMVERLNQYGAKMNDEVKLRTKEARESQLQAELANKAKTIFMMTITNELRTPLNGILGMAAVAYCEKSASLESLKSMLRTIISSSEILRELLQQLLNYSTLLAGDEINYQEFTLECLKESILDSHSSCAEAGGIELAVNVDPDRLKKCSIGSDLGKIAIICANLVSNAIKFSNPEKVEERGGSKRSAKVTVYIHLHSVQSTMATSGSKEDSATENSTGIFISSLIPGDGKLFVSKRHSPESQPGSNNPNIDTPPMALLEIVVSDNGVGMNCTHLKNIFEPFVQGENTLSKSFTGTGLGLAMSKMVCESLNGDIIIQTQLNVGSVAKLRVPVTNVNATELLGSPQNNLSMMDPQKHICFTDSSNPGVARCTSISSTRTEDMMWRGFAEGNIQLIPLKKDSRDQASLRSRQTKQASVENLVSKDNSAKDMSLHQYYDTNSEVRKLNYCQISAADMNSDMRMETIQMLNDIATLNAYDSVGVLPRIDRLHNRIPSLSTSAQSELSLPRLSAKEVVPTQVNPSLDFTQFKVLIADDNETVRYIMQRFLLKIGIGEVETVSDGASAIKRIEKAIVQGYQYSIVFMDLSMPNFSGIEVTRAIRRQLGYYCPVVALTGYSDPQTVRACEEAGIQRILVKPVNFQTLLKAVADLASR